VEKNCRRCVRSNISRIFDRENNIMLVSSFSLYSPIESRPACRVPRRKAASHEPR
jgi:hypothetical protein